MKKFKSLTQIKREGAYYFVSINNCIDYESSSLIECKNYLCKALKEDLNNEIDRMSTFIGMYNISID